jgi:hypothetical protein
MAFTLNGIGTRYSGTRWLPDGSYVTTKWFVIVYMPILPLGSVRVVEASQAWGSGFYGGQSMKAHPVPLDWRMVLSYYGWVAVVIAAIAAYVVLANRYHWV